MDILALVIIMTGVLMLRDDKATKIVPDLNLIRSRKPPGKIDKTGYNHEKIIKPLNTEPNHEKTVPRTVALYTLAFTVCLQHAW